MSGPFGEAATQYLAAGWHPLYLPYRKKKAPPSGYTGYTGDNATPEEIERWVGNPRIARGNICLRLPTDVLGIDVDTYDGKVGAATLREALERLGDLPATFSSTSRPGTGSRIMFFRVPPGRQWADVLGPDVEIIHHGHRYSIVWPSVHPLGPIYGWYDENDMPIMDVPRTGELPALSPEWVAELDRGSVEDRPVSAQLEDEEIADWINGLVGGGPCRYLSSILEDAGRDLDGGGSRHDTGRFYVLKIIGAGEQGHKGAVTALGTLKELWLDALGGDREGGTEWSRMVSGAVKRVLGDPTPDEDRECCTGVAEDFDTTTIFNVTPVLKKIEQAAHARLVSAPAVLGCILLRVLTEIPPNVVLPATVGAAASLNLGLAVVGGSGDGKSAAMDVSEELLGIDQGHMTRVVGSGEGMIESFITIVKVPDPGDPDKLIKVRTVIEEPHRLFTVDEIGQFKAIGGRDGSTLESILRTALTGGQMGTENASEERRRNVPRGSYRLTMMAGVQPAMSDTLLKGTNVGTPQRFIWVSAVDRTLPAEDVGWPDGGLDWDPAFITVHADLEEQVTVGYPDHVRDEIKETRRRRVQNGGDPLKGHLLLTQLKVAAALAFLHQEDKITDQWWGLSESVIQMSLAVQSDCRYALFEERREADERKGRSDASVEVARSEAIEDLTLTRVKTAIIRVLGKTGESSWSDLRRALRANHRPSAEDALSELEREGKVRSEEIQHKGQSGVRVYLT